MAKKSEEILQKNFVGKNLENKIREKRLYYRIMDSTEVEMEGEVIKKAKSKMIRLEMKKVEI